MAVFLRNDCKFGGCGLNFQCLGDLIHHIEDKHIDSDPKVLEQQETEPPSSLALSYILRFFTEAARREHSLIADVASLTCPPLNPKCVAIAPLKDKTFVIKEKALPVSRISTPTGSEADEEELPSEDDSDDSWTTQEEFSVDHILGMVNSREGVDPDKPFACPVPGCKKKYKNINGIKYHARNGHRKDNSRVRKTYKCHCGKTYKSSSGLKNHTTSHHPTTELLSLQALFPPALIKGGATPIITANGILSSGQVITLTQSPTSQPLTLPLNKVITTMTSPMPPPAALLKVVPPFLPSTSLSAKPLPPSGSLTVKPLLPSASLQTMTTNPPSLTTRPLATTPLVGTTPLLATTSPLATTPLLTSTPLQQMTTFVPTTTPLFPTTLIPTTFIATTSHTTTSQNQKFTTPLARTTLHLPTTPLKTPTTTPTLLPTLSLTPHISPEPMAVTNRE